MIERSKRFHCKSCSSTTDFQSAGYYPDGSQRFICAGCKTNGGVLHKCSHNNLFAPPQWLPLLLAGIDVVCPKCKAAYDLGVKIEPTYPDAGEILQAAGLVVGSIILAGVIVEIIKQMRRSL